MEKGEQKRERWERIINSEYNKWYKKIKGVRVPKHLKKGWGESKWRRVARFRLGNEMKESRYWEKEEKRRCKLCGWRRESWEHVWEDCREWKKGEGSWQEAIGYWVKMMKGRNG